MRALVAAALVLAACGGGRGRPPTISAAEQPVVRTAGDRILPLLPDGAQVIVEIDLARLRANPVVGKIVTAAIADDGLALPDLPRSPLAHADALVLASYGVGTGQAATVTVLATAEAVPKSVPLGDGLVALGPEEWTAQLEARAAIARTKPLIAAKDLLALRDHAMPPGAPGAALRITARLSFDARVELARETGMEAPPAMISVWADVVDDLAVIVDADAADPGDKKTAHPTRRLETGVRGMLAGLAGEPAIRALGIPASLQGARIVARGSWVRTIVAIGPAHLQRVVDRAAAMLQGKS